MPSPPSTPKSFNNRTFTLPPTTHLRATVKSTSLDHELFQRNVGRNSFAGSRHHGNSLQDAYSLKLSRISNKKKTSTTLKNKAVTIVDKKTSSKLSGQQFNYQEFRASILKQGKCLCAQYIRNRLRRSGFLNRKAIQILRSSLETNSDVVYSIFPLLNTIGEELERMYPRIYNNVSKQLSRLSAGELTDGNMALMMLNVVAKELFAVRHQTHQKTLFNREEITWAKIISLFAICGAFSVDCVRKGHYDYLPLLVESVGEIIEEDLMQWLLDHGGWLGLRLHIRSPELKLQIGFVCWLIIFVILSSGAYILATVFGYLSNLLPSKDQIQTP